MERVKEKKNIRVNVWGVVQGVGFRPFIYRIALRRGLEGWVRNTSEKVEIEIEGHENALRTFLDELKSEAPPVSRIEKVEVVRGEVKGYDSFRIVKSLEQSSLYQLVSPDIAVCGDCIREIISPKDRRYRYAFTNCTNCGPRFTIIEDIPYDRPKTTMREFEMCSSCRSEYEDMLDRRFHAQPNACPVCGPQLELRDRNDDRVESKDIIRSAAELLNQGNILAIKGLGGFQLACDATNSKAVEELRKRKKRPAKPFAVMIKSLDEVRKHCLVNSAEKHTLESPESPIVLLRWKTEVSDITEETAPGLKYLGVMLPYTPLHYLLLHDCGKPLIMTSGNVSEETIAKDNEEALEKLKGIADYFVLHNRDIRARYDDSVYMTEVKTQPIRRARGVAPYPVFLPFRSKQILACGAEEKNTICLTKDDHAFVSQHIGDLENLETLESFEETIEIYRRLFRIDPEWAACDLHPEYLSSKYAREKAREMNIPLIEVQHHHAHIASGMVEYGLQEPVIGAALDGTGYGADGTIWGGEFLVADLHGYKRAAHLETLPLAGGAAAIKKPYRAALGYIYSLFGDDFPWDELPLKANKTERGIIRKQVEKGINAPLTSSAGRLFDAVSAMLGIRQTIDYSAQAAIELEMAASSPRMFHDLNDEFVDPYAYSIVGGEPAVIQLKELFWSVTQDIMGKKTKREISDRFHMTVACIVLDTVRRISETTGINKVVLSGGVFQNRLLLNLTYRLLMKNKFEVFIHHLLPCNDGCIALGQAAVAAAKADH